MMVKTGLKNIKALSRMTYIRAKNSIFHGKGAATSHGENEGRNGDNGFLQGALTRKIGNLPLKARLLHVLR